MHRNLHSLQKIPPQDKLCKDTVDPFFTDNGVSPCRLLSFIGEYPHSFSPVFLRAIGDDNILYEIWIKSTLLHSLSSYPPLLLPSILAPKVKHSLCILYSIDILVSVF